MELTEAKSASETGFFLQGMLQALDFGL